MSYPSPRRGLVFMGSLLLAGLVAIPASAAPPAKCLVCVIHKKHGPQTKEVNCKSVPRLVSRGATEGPCDGGGGQEDSCSTRAELAGSSLASYPFFDFGDSHNVNSALELAIDPNQHPDIAGQTCDVYITAGQTETDWCNDGTLVDVRGTPDTRTFVSGTLQANTFPLAPANSLSADAGTGIGVGYDVVLDCDQNGQLDQTDYIDGLYNDRDGFYVVGDLTALGPEPTNFFEEINLGASPTIQWNGEGDDMKVFYPAALDDPGFVGTFPLVVVSHGNGHQYWWYDFLQDHLASYGYIVMSHVNNTGPGIQQASLSTLRWTDRLFDEQSTLGGGVLDGHIDGSQILWVGHSRGGEGVTRAYDRLLDGSYSPLYYDQNDIQGISSIAPTDFLGHDLSNAHDRNYSLIYGAADGDVNGCTSNDVATSFNLYERAVGTKSSTYLHGASHNDFNACGFGLNDGTGPNLIGCVEAQQVQKAHTLAFAKFHQAGERGAKDYLWRQFETLKPMGVAASTVVVQDFKEAETDIDFVLDDFESNDRENKSSSGGSVSWSVNNYFEGLMDDIDNRFAWSSADPMNGMTRNNRSQSPIEDFAAIVFDYNGGASEVRFETGRGDEDFSSYDWLSVRAAQGTRHPETTAELGDLTFTVTLEDGGGNSSSINIGAYGGGIEEPYQRTGCGSGGGAGWQNEMEVTRIRLSDFLTNGSGVDLSNIAAVVLEFGPGFGSSRGRVAVDDLYLFSE